MDNLFYTSLVYRRKIEIMRLSKVNVPQNNLAMYLNSKFTNGNTSMVILG